ncbi:Phage virion morphogenesis family protein [compost metagenome]
MVDSNALEFGSNRIYAAVHQFGALQGAFGTSARGVPLPWGDIPARPWLGMTDTDREAALDIVQDYLLRRTAQGS